MRDFYITSNFAIVESNSMNKVDGKSHLDSGTHGFTLIEMLMTMSIIALLSTAVLIAINPLNIILSARDTTRLNAVDTINKAIQSYLINNNGGISCDMFGSCPTDFALTGTDSVSTLLLQDKYLQVIPSPPADPTSPEFCDYHLFLYKDINGEDDYMLRWCFESWVKADVDRLTSPDYLCNWNDAAQIATCFTNRTYGIPTVKP